MRVRIRLDDRAHCLIGKPLHLDGRRMGRVTAPEMEFDVSRGWHVLEVRDLAHQTRPMHFQVGPRQDVEAHVLPARPGYLDYAWFELVTS